jgi:threonine synthase
VQAADVKPIEYALRHDSLPDEADGTTMADSIDVKVPRNWRKAVRAVRDSGGEIVTASDDEILDAMRLAGRHGVFAEPAAAAALAGIVASIDSKMIAAHDRVLAMITGSGLKDTRSAIRAAGRPIAIEPDVAAVAEQLEGSMHLTNHKGHQGHKERPI